MLLSPPVSVGGVPPCGATPPVGGRGAIVVLSWCRNDAEMTRQERYSIKYAGAQRGLHLTVAPEGGFGAEIFFNREIFASRRRVPLKKRNIVEILLSFAPVPATRSGRWWTVARRRIELLLPGRKPGVLTTRRTGRQRRVNLGAPQYRRQGNRKRPSLGSCPFVHRPCQSVTSHQTRL